MEVFCLFLVLMITGLALGALLPKETEALKDADSVLDPKSRFNRFPLKDQS